MFFASFLSLIVMFFYLAMVVAVPVLIGVYVYRDAVQRSMNAVLWTLVAVLAPGFIGFIIYLIVRGNYSDLKCPNCTSAVTDQYMMCPVCGTRLKASCPSCNFPLEADWSVCPSCTTPLPDDLEEFTPPAKRGDTGLKKILVAVIIIPIVLVLISVLSFGMYSTSGIVELHDVSTNEVEVHQVSPSFSDLND